MPMTRNDLRDVVFRQIVREADANPGLKAVVESLGFFTFMRLVDGVVNAVQVAMDAIPQEDNAP